MTGIPWPAMLLVGAAFLGLFVVGELVHRRLGVPPELSRKLDHAGAGPIALVLPAVFDSAWPVVVLAAGFLAFLVLTRSAGLLRSVHGIPRASVGAYLYPVAVAATFVLAEGRPDRYAVAIAALAFADAAGGLVGAQWGRTTYTAWGRPKSIEGSLATFTVTAGATVIVLLVFGAAPFAALIAGAYTGAVVGFVEGALPLGTDNLGVPLAALAALSVVGSPAGAALLLLGAIALLHIAIDRPEPSWVGLPRRPVSSTTTPDLVSPAADLG
jgi:phytol kinase